MCQDCCCRGYFCTFWVFLCTFLRILLVQKYDAQQFGKLLLPHTNTFHMAQEINLSSTVQNILHHYCTTVHRKNIGLISMFGQPWFTSTCTTRKLNYVSNSLHNIQCINVCFNGQSSPSTLCGSSTQYLTKEVIGPVGAESLLKYVKFDIMESILSFCSFLAPDWGNLHIQINM